MRNLLSAIGRFLTELRRRKVYQVAIGYVVVGFMVIEAADLTFVRLGLPSWTVTLVVALVGLGFPIALVLAWALEVTPEGVRVDTAEETAEEGPQTPAPATPSLWVGASVLALLLVGTWWMWGGLSGSEREGSGAAESPARDTTAPPRIAVLPFENIAPDSTDDYFARGMHEEILNQLSKVSGLEVLSRSSVLRYAGTDTPVQKISKELGGVRAVLEGTVRRAGGRVRITAQLIDAGKNAHLWSKAYEQALSVKEIFDIQVDIAEQIAGALQTKLVGRERQRIESVPTRDLAAYDKYVQGRTLWWKSLSSRDPDNLDRSMGHFRAAIRQDSAFAEAYAWLARGYWSRHLFSDDKRWIDSAAVAVEHAKRLAPPTAIVHTAEGDVLLFRDSLDAAERAFKKAFELQPSNLSTVGGLHALYEWREEWAKALRWGYREYRLNPNRARNLSSIGDDLLDVGMLEPAKAWFQRVHDSAPDDLVATRGLVRLALFTKTPDQARLWIEKYLADHGDDPEALAIAAEIALRDGEPGEAKEYLGRVREARRRRFPEDSPSRPERIRLNPEERRLLGLAELRIGNETRGRELLRTAADSLRDLVTRQEQFRSQRLAALASTLAAQGKRGEAFRSLEQAADEGYPRVQWVATYPLFAPLRSDPRFQQILGQIEANQRHLREQVRQLDIELYPPGAAEGTARRKGNRKAPRRQRIAFGTDSFTTASPDEPNAQGS